MRLWPKRSFDILRQLTTSLEQYDQRNSKPVKIRVHRLRLLPYACRDVIDLLLFDWLRVLPTENLETEHVQNNCLRDATRLDSNVK